MMLKPESACIRSSTRHGIKKEGTNPTDKAFIEKFQESYFMEQKLPLYFQF